MSRTAGQLRVALEKARTAPVFAFGDVTEAEARADRAAAIADLTARLVQREAEESGSWNGIGD
uniref:hypothetical protein n=1 Tax=Amycolatopsis sp. CA-096443 TaxID=3239919 RepID=UPI003F491790